MGAIVIQCLYGYGDKEFEPHILRGVGELPHLVEIVDEPVIIQQLLPKIKDLVRDNGLISVEEIYVY